MGHWLGIFAAYLAAAVFAWLYAVVLFRDWPNAKTYQRISQISGARPRNGNTETDERG